MLKKIIIRATLLNVIIFHSCAMDKPIEAAKQNTRYLTKRAALSFPTQIAGLFEEVKVQTEINIPLSFTNEDTAAFLQAHGRTIHEKENKIIVAYCRAKERAGLTPALKALLNIHPSALYVNPMTNKLTLRKEWYKCRLSGNRPVYLETRIECLYNPKTGMVTPGPLMLYIFQQDKPKKYMCVSMERLRAIFPEPNSLNITAKNREQKKKESRDKAIAQIEPYLLHGRAPESSPDPEAFYDRLYFEDLKVMAAYFLTTQDILDID